MSAAVAKTLVYGTPIVGGGLGTAYGVTRETVGYALASEGYRVSNIPNNYWDKVFEKFKTKTGLEDEDFKSLHGKESKNKEDLRDLCQKRFDTVYKSIFKEYEKIIKSTKEYCFISLKDAMETTTEYTNVKDQLSDENLKSYSATTLTGELKTAQDDLKGEDANKKNKAKETQAKWCQSKYDSIYLGPDDESYKIFKEICKKKTTS